jgi:hypothetical protein
VLCDAAVRAAIEGREISLISFRDITDRPSLDET